MKHLSERRGDDSLGGVDRDRRFVDRAGCLVARVNRDADRDL
jgi:hypothetical protein